MKINVFNNIGLKILSVCLAMFLWFFVTYRGQSEIAIDTHLEFKNIPKGLEILRQNVKTVSLSISGQERILKGLKSGDVRVIIDLSDAKKGEATYYIGKNNAVVYKSVKVLRVDPTSVRVVLDESISKVVPVKAHIIGAPEAGYKIKSVIVSPSLVKVEGPRTEIAGIGVLRTEPLEITGIDADIAQDVRLNTGGKNIRTDISEVHVKIDIERIKK